MSNLETGIYYDRPSAERVISELESYGYSREDISVIMRDKEAAQRFASATGTQTTDATVTGASIGGLVGLILGALTATGSVATIAATGGIATPLVVGPLAAALAGLGAGGVTGGVIGALIGAGIPADQAREYEEGLNRGGLLVVLKPRLEDRERVRRALAMQQTQPVNTVTGTTTDPLRTRTPTTL